MRLAARSRRSIARRRFDTRLHRRRAAHLAHQEIDAVECAPRELARASGSVGRAIDLSALEPTPQWNAIGKPPAAWLFHSRPRSGPLRCRASRPQARSEGERRTSSETASKRVLRPRAAYPGRTRARLRFAVASPLSEARLARPLLVSV